MGATRPDNQEVQPGTCALCKKPIAAHEDGGQLCRDLLEAVKGAEEEQRNLRVLERHGFGLELRIEPTNGPDGHPRVSLSDESNRKIAKHYKAEREAIGVIANALRQQEFLEREDTEARRSEYRRTYLASILRKYKWPIRVCPECGERFLVHRSEAILNQPLVGTSTEGQEPRRSDAMYHEGCASRRRNRGRGKIGNGKSAAENAIARREKRLGRHQAACRVCRDSGFCSHFQILVDAALTSVDALDNLHPALTPDGAERVAAQGGRTPRRSTEAERPGFILRRRPSP